MSESFSFDVNYATTFKQIERLRSLMLSFVQMERRDFQPSFDVVVLGLCHISSHLESGLILDPPHKIYPTRKK